MGRRALAFARSSTAWCAIVLALSACGSVRDTRDASADIGRFVEDALSDSMDVRDDADAARATVDAYDASVDGVDAYDASVPVYREVMRCGWAIAIRGISCDDDSTHIDCFGGGGCEGGVAWRNAYAPMPVPNVCNLETDLTHICCIEQVTCALGCASDWRDRLGPGPDLFDPRVLCAETEWCPDGGDVACDGSAGEADAATE